MTTTGEDLPDTCDAAVIGAGIGGLTAGAILAKAGLNTVVLETNSQPGGCLAGFERRGFQFDASVQWLSQCGPGGFVRHILNYAGRNDMPDCPPLKRLHRLKGDDFDYTLTTDPILLRDQMIRDFPEDKEGIMRFFKDAQNLGEHLRILNDRTQSKESMTPLENIIYQAKMLKWVLPVLPHIRTPVDKALANYFTTPGPRAVFASHETFMSVIVPVAWAFIENFQAPPAGGSAAMIHWLCQTLESYGAKVCPGRRVENISIDRKTATAVRMADGDRLSARHIIAACDIQTLYNKLLPENSVPARLKKKINNTDLHESCFSIYLGLDCNPADLGFGEEVLNLMGTNLNRSDHVSGDPGHSVIKVVALSARDASMAPAGKGSLMIQCPAYISYQNNWATGKGFQRGQAYRDLKAAFADVIISRVEAAFAPELRAHIEVMTIATPVTYWRYTANANGTTMGARPTARNIRSKTARYRTPIKNLFIGGHCAEYGGGVPLAVKAGANSSLLVLKELKHKEFKKLKKIMARS